MNGPEEGLNLDSTGLSRRLDPVESRAFRLRRSRLTSGVTGITHPALFFLNLYSCPVMANTEVILREKITNLGAEADVVSVKRGYARNFLIPSGKAYEATTGNLRNIEKLQQVRAQREAEELVEAEKIATKLRKTKLSMQLAIGQAGKAFGSITTADIAKAILDKAKVEIDRHQIVLDKPIKGTGEFEIPVKVHADIEVVMTLKVKAEKDEEDDSEGGSDN